MMPNRVAALEVESLCVDYQTLEGPVQAVSGLSLTVRSSETVALIGESGCGKTTAALAILGMLPTAGRVSGGRVSVHGEGKRIELLELSPEERRRLRWRHIAYVPQGSISAFNPIQKVSRHFQQTAHAHGMSSSQASLRATELLRAVQLDDKRVLNSYPHELSGGTRQRVAIALAMLLRPQVMVLDEPTTALDVITQEAVLETLIELQRETGIAYLLITHDLEVATAVADTVTTMYAGRPVESGSAADIVDRPLHPYTRGLMRATPSLDMNTAVPIGGQPPDLRALPAGCAFHPRCVLAQDSCRFGAPPALLPLEARMVACPVVVPPHSRSKAGAP